MHQFDVVFDMLVVNQTADVLQGLTVELATLGNLKLMERPQPCTLAPHDFTNIKTNIKVGSCGQCIGARVVGLFAGCRTWSQTIVLVEAVDCYSSWADLRSENTAQLHAGAGHFLMRTVGLRLT